MFRSFTRDAFPFTVIENGYPFQDKEFRYLKYQDNNDEDAPEATDGNGGNPKDKGAGGSPVKKTNPSKARAYYKYRLT